MSSEDEALSGRTLVELLGREATAAARRAAALLHHPGQHTAGAEDVAARRGQRVLQDLVAQSALQVRVPRRRRSGPAQTHGGGAGARSPPGGRPPLLPTSQPRRAGSAARSLAGSPGLSLIAPDFLGKCPRNRTPSAVIARARAQTILPLRPRPPDPKGRERGREAEEEWEDTEARRGGLARPRRQPEPFPRKTPLLSLAVFTTGDPPAGSG